jgi:hypothetical protein
MKRIQFYSILALAVLFTATIIFWHYSQNRVNKNLETLSIASPSTTNNLAVEAGAAPSASQISHEPNQQPMPKYMDTNAPEFQKLIAAVHAQSEKTIAERNKPIAFYGKVVDEETQAIAGASIHFIWLTAQGTPETDAASATDGSFSLTGVVGGEVSVYVSKKGYYEVRSLNGVTFDNTGNGSSKENPVLFQLRKKGMGTDLITSKFGFTPWFDVHVPIDGTPIKVDLLNRSAGNNGQMEFSNIKPEYLQARQATNWSFKMEIPDGGFVEENDEFPFEAPEEGYQQIVEFNFQKSQPDWTDMIQKDYYIKFGSPAQYGYLHLETTIGSGVRMTYAINPTGSRNLEQK